MEKEKKITRLEMLEETAESMKLSLDNLKKVQNEQAILLDLISNSEKKEFFKDFIEESQIQLQRFKAQEEKLTEKRNALISVINSYKQNKYHGELLETFMTALGLYE